MVQNHSYFCNNIIVKIYTEQNTSDSIRIGYPDEILL